MDWRDRLREIGERIQFQETVDRWRERFARWSPSSLQSEANPAPVRMMGAMMGATAAVVKTQNRGFYGKLATVLICTYFVSEVTSMMIEGLLPEPTAPKAIRKPPSSRGADFRQYDIIAGRNLFNSKGLIPEDKPTKLDPGDQKPVKTSLPFQLLGTIILDDERHSLATIQDKTAGRTYPVRITDEIPAKAQILKVEARKVTFINLRNRRPEYVELPEDFKPAIRSTPTRTAAPSVSSKSETRFSIGRSEIEKSLSNLSEILTQALARPVMENGQPAGWKLSQIVKGSIYDQLGLKNGDVLKGFDGQPITDPGAAWEKLQDLKNLNQVEIQVTRGGKEMTLTYDIL